MCLKIFHFKCVYIGQPVSEISEFLTAYIHKCTIKTIIFAMHPTKLKQTHKISDNSNNVHFSGVRFICSPYLAIKSALASLWPIMARCGPQMNLTPSK